MDAIAQTALSNLQTVLNGYLPSVSSVSIERSLLVIPHKIKPLGIGGYVGLHDDPVDDIFGRFVEADAEILVGATNNSLDTINAEVSAISSSLMTVSREDLRGDGIYFLDLKSLSEPGSDNQNLRRLLFSIRYEYQQIPTEAGGVIDTLDIRSFLNSGDSKASFLANINTAILASEPDPLADFSAFTDTRINGSSPSANWQYNIAEHYIEQTNTTRGGGLTLNSPRKAGAQLLYRPSGDAIPIENGILSSSVSTTDQDGIGFVFRWQDIENFYFFLISQRHNYQLFGKKIAGNFSFLTTGGIGDTIGIDLSSPQIITVHFNHHFFRAVLNENTLAEGEDNDLSSGEVGWLTHANNAAHFHTLDIVSVA